MGGDPAVPPLNSVKAIYGALCGSYPRSETPYANSVHRSKVGRQANQVGRGFDSALDPDPHIGIDALCADIVDGRFREDAFVLTNGQRV
jgi:hypothetical protein